MRFAKILLGVALTSLSLSQSTTSDCNYEWMTQPIDHHGATNGTFQQRFSVFSEFFKPGGPIMFFQGEESWALDCANTTVQYTYARELKGIAVSLEHRYFGQSLPFGDASHTPENMEYLSLDNVMADAVAFISQIKENYTGAADSKAIVASGSYGGFLAAAFRLSRPDTFYGALASAGPVPNKGFVNSTDPNIYNWWTWVNRVYLDRSAEASAKIKRAFKVLQSRLASTDIASLKDQLGLCTSPSLNDTVSLGQLRTFLTLVFSQAVELNYPVPQPGRAPVANAVDEVIKIALDEDDPMQILNRTFWLWYGAEGPGHANCFNFTDSNFASKAVWLIEQTPFRYIVCSYFPLRSNFIPNGTIFLPTGTDAVKLSAENCQRQWGITPLTDKEIEERYHFSPADIQKSTRIIWSNGEFDPVSAVSVSYLPPSVDPCASRMILTSNMAHCEDLFLPGSSDRVTITQLREKEIAIFKEWLTYC